MLVGCVWGAQRQSLSQKVGSVVGPNQRLAYCSRSFSFKNMLFFSFFPHIFVWGSCFWFCIRVLPRLPASSRLPPPPLHKHLSHTILVNHHLSHTIFHTPSFTHHLSHTSLSTTIFHTPSLTHHLSHTSLSTTIFHTPSFTHHLSFSTWCGTWRRIPSSCVAGVALMALGWLWWRAWAGSGRRWHRGTLRGRRGPWWHPPSFRVAGVALGHILLRFAWQAWHLWHWAGSGGVLGPVLVAGDAAALCVAGVALGDIHLRFAWQAWHLVTSTFVLRGRRVTCGTGLPLVARLGRFWSPVTPWHFAWQVWHLVTSTFVSRGRRGTWLNPP